MNTFHATNARLAADAELRSAGSAPVASLRLAVDAGYGDKRTTLWLSASLWGARAEKLAPMLKKGGKINVVGELSQREYTAKDGSKANSLELRISEIEFAGPRAEATEAPAQPAPAAAPELADEIPF